MTIPYDYDRMGAAGATAANSAKIGVRGCFTFSGGRTNRSGMVLSDTELAPERTNIMHVSSGGFADAVRVASMCSACIFGGGAASGVLVASGGVVSATSGATVDGIVVAGSRGAAVVQSGAVATNVVVKQAGTCYLSGSASGVTVDQYGVVYGGGHVAGASVSYGSCIASRFDGASVGSMGKVFFSSGTDISLAQGASATVYASGRASGVSAASGAVLAISAGAEVTGVAMDDGALVACDLDPYDGTVVDGTYAGGALSVSGGMGSGLRIGSAITMNVRHRGSAMGARILSAGRLHLHDGAYASGTIMDDGAQASAIGSGLMEDTVVGFTARQVVANGGSAYRNTLLPGGMQLVSTWGVASDTQVSSGGLQIVGFAGTAIATVLGDGASLVVSSGGMVSNAVVGSGGYANCWANCNVDVLSVASGGVFSGHGNKVENVIVDGGGNLACNSARGGGFAIAPGARLNAYSCVFSDVSLGGDAFAGSDSRLEAVGISSGAVCWVMRGTVLSGVRIYSGGSMHVSSGCMALAVTSDAGAIVTSNAGAVVEYA